ncbi:hypothetical protein D5R81_15090 [Parashewanella spongiae]|uniref:Uncharacterized protein n=1 Tax=Parashewanella spongiae TaxID=342950 RepID=A0A3A6U3B1_9GAMM|nr:hypothetical protein D5R81_15090 [Parashewanella spongiae]
MSLAKPAATIVIYIIEESSNIAAEFECLAVVQPLLFKREVWVDFDANVINRVNGARHMANTVNTAQLSIGRIKLTF